MIHITVTAHDDRIRSLEITGHSGSAQRGRDLVCAAVSGIAFGLCNAMDILTQTETITVEGNRICIQVNEPTDMTQAVMQTGIIQLETIAEQNSRFIKINKMEV